MALAMKEGADPRNTRSRSQGTRSSRMAIPKFSAMGLLRERSPRQSRICGLSTILILAGAPNMDSRYPRRVR
jgi:hypothetical protein